MTIGEKNIILWVFHLQLLCSEVAIKSQSSGEFPSGGRSINIGNMTWQRKNITGLGHLPSLPAD
jgi:hypothetical protein